LKLKIAKIKSDILLGKTRSMRIPV
jgi:hypothetical protein